jgi:hypothetical protein
MTSTIDWRTHTNAERSDGTDVPCLSFEGVEQLHDWTLIVEAPRGRDEDGRERFARRWYCRRCRLVEQWTSSAPWTS